MTMTYKSYNDICNRLNFYFSEHGGKDISMRDEIVVQSCYHLFYNYDDLNVKPNVEIYVLCVKSCGMGDVINGIKTYNTVKKYFDNVSLLTVNAFNKTFIEKICKDIHTIYILDELISITSCTKIFIMPCIPLYHERFNDIPGTKKFIFIDEYNGWRITLPKNTDSEADDDSINESDDDQCEKILLEDHDRLECNKCLKKEHYIEYNISLSSDESEIDKDMYLITSGLGKTLSGIPTGGVHITTDFGPESTFRDFLHRECLEEFYCFDKYYFVYFSTNQNENDSSLMYLERFYTIVTELNKEQYTNFVIIDPNSYLLKNNRKNIVSFIVNDNIKICKLGMIIENDDRKTNILYRKDVKRTDMLSLMINSEPLIFLSGDQSFVEAICLQKINKTKIIFYQIHPWKENLIKEYGKITKKLLGVDAELVKLQKEIYNEDIMDLGMVKSLLRNKLDTLIEQSNVVYEYIINNYDIEQTIISSILFMIYDDDNTLAMIKDMLNDYLNDNWFKKTFTKFVTYVNRSDHPNALNYPNTSNNPYVSNTSNELNSPERDTSDGTEVPTKKLKKLND